MGNEKKFTTAITKVTEDDIVVRGHRLAEDLVGKMSFTDVFFLHMFGRKPKENESKMFEALMVTSIDHGINHPVTMARMTYASAPETIQAAIAAGIVGMGSVTDGAIELVASLLYQIAKVADEQGISDEEAVRIKVSEYRSQNKFIPGLGHPVHKSGDPRTTRLFNLAKEFGFEGRYVALVRLISKVASEAAGKEIPLNGASAVASLYCELGFPAQIAKACTIVSVSAGVTGHLMEEMKNPMGRGLRGAIKNAIEFQENQ